MKSHAHSEGHQRRDATRTVAPFLGQKANNFYEEKRKHFRFTSFETSDDLYCAIVLQKLTCFHRRTTCRPFRGRRLNCLQLLLFKKPFPIATSPSTDMIALGYTDPKQNIKRQFITSKPSFVASSEDITSFLIS
jgi:hypothetical protein